jgi:hypothetical protein
MGFRLGAWSFVNSNTVDFASWTFRKAEKFFDVVTYTGTGVARTIAHNLGVAPGMIIIKQTNTTRDWIVYHSSLGTAQYISLNRTNGAGPDSSGEYWNSTAPTSTEFSLGDYFAVNQSGGSYVAYLFASDAGGFGDDDENIIKCGSYTGNGSATGPEIDLGFEPQWVMIKRASADGTGWYMHDIMRGMPNGGTDSWLEANSSAAEVNSVDWIHPTATGFNITNTQTGINGSGDTYIYIAIRRPMKTPESGTEVFDVQQSITTDPNFVTGFNPDMTFSVPSTTASFRYIFSRLTGTGFMETSNTNAESTGGAIKWDYSGGAHNGFTSYYGWNFRRATGFFDVVAYAGNNVNNRQLPHNLGVVPELVINKSRSNSTIWYVWVNGVSPTNKCLLLNLNLDWGSGYNTGFQSSTSTNLNISTASGEINISGQTYVAYLFATVAGVSKVGSYTGTAADLNVDCGFSAGARFILIKRTDSTGDWYVWDSVRGIVAGNDPYLLLNSTAAEVTGTDYIDPLSSGFTVTSSAPAALNASGGTYIFLAIA